MPINYDIETDYLYLRGFEKGLEIAKQRLFEDTNKRYVTNLVLGTDFDDIRIAALVQVNVSFVKKIRASLSKKD